MRLLSRLRSWLRGAARRSRLETGMSEELRFHLEERAQHLIESGMEADEARRRAQAEIGSLAAYKESMRDSLGLRTLDNLRADLVYAFRQVSKNPGVTAISILSIGLGIGATTAVYSVSRAVLLDPLPYKDPDRMIHLRDTMTARVFEAWQALDVFDGLVATDYYNMSLTSGDLPEAVFVARMSPNAFEFFGIPPALGRTFAAAGSPPNQEPERAVVLSHKFWQSHYGGSRDAVGTTLELDHEKYAVIGVMPPRFRWMNCDLFVPMNLSYYTAPSLNVDGRLRAGVSLEQATSAALARMRQVATRLPANFRLNFELSMEAIRGRFRTTMILFLTAVFVLLAVACANVSILMLARGTARQHELALRAAIGAGRRRLANQLLTESLFLTICGAVLGVGIAWAGLAGLLSWLPASLLPVETDVSLNVTVLALSTMTALITGVLAGLAPAIRLSHPRLHELVRNSGGRVAGTFAGRRAQQALVCAQVALTVLLLAGAGAAVRALVDLYRTDLGYDPTGIVRVTIPTPEGSYPSWEERKTFFQAAVNRVGALPQVEAAALGPFQAPFYGATRPLEIFGQENDPQRRVPSQEVSTNFFAVLRIPIVQGRTWTEAETERGALVAVINQEMARRFWPNGNAIGSKIRFPSLQPGQWVRTPEWSRDWIEIIGIVGNVRNAGLQRPTAAAAYFPFSLSVGDNMALLVRSRDTARVVQEIRKQVHGVAAGQPVAAIATGESILREIGWQREEVVSALFTVFAGLALLLAAIGLYSAVSYASNLRAREFGIRMAVGATKGDIIRLVARPAAAVVGVGIAVGIAGSLAANKLLASFTRATVYDPWVLGSVTVVLVLAAALASVTPVLRAARVDPATTLRE